MRKDLNNAIASDFGHKVEVMANLASALEESEHKHDEIQRIAKLGHWTLDIVNKDLQPSDETLRIFGLESEIFQPSYKTFLNVIHPDDRERVDKAYSDSLKNRTLYEVEHRLLMPDGEIKWVFERCETSYSEDGTPLHSIGTVRDITERKQAEEKLQKSEERFKLAMRGANDGLWDWNLETDEVYYSPRWKSMLGYHEIELGDTFAVWTSLLHSDDKDDILEKLEHCIKSSADTFEAEMRMCHKQGHWVSVLSRGFLMRRNSDHKAIRLVGTHVDITERKQLEEENRAHIRHLEGMQKIADAASYSLSPEDMLNSVIETTREIFQSDRAWMLHPCDTDSDYWEIPIESTVPEYPGAFALNKKIPTSPEVQQLMNDALNSLEPVIYCPVPNLGSSIEPFTVRSQMMMAIRPKFGKPWLLGLHQCSHERAWTTEEIALFQSIAMKVSDILYSAHLNRDLQKLSQAVQQSGEAVLITDRNAVIEYVNPAFTEMTGYTQKEIIGKTPDVLKSTSQTAALCKNIWDYITQGKVWHGTLVNKRKNGGFYPALVSVAPIYNDHGDTTHFVSFQQDMSEYQQMEENFLQAQKMEAMGTLVGGIAHDFNNVLAAIQGNIYLTRRTLENQPEIADKLDSIALLSSRAAGMVKQLLTFARRDRIEMNVFSLNSFIKEAYKLAKTAIPENIELICNHCQEDLIIDGDTTQLQQVLMNLLNNARDAVSHVSQPKITCTLKPFTATDAFKNAHPNVDTVRFAQLSMKDNGYGISQENLNKIFEPFFTTKEVGKGTGLGLAMVYGAVQSHAGTLVVESEIGAGTTFNIYLPLQDELKIQNQDQDQEEIMTTVQGQGETILLVDDEAVIRNTTGEVLSNLGYKILKASNGEEAFKIFKSHQKDIDLIITDIVMPKMGGFDLAACLRQYKAEVPIIFATGYDQMDLINHDNEMRLGLIVNKPFTFAELSQSIRAMINDHQKKLPHG